MDNVIQIPTRPKVFNTVFLVRLSECNRATRQLRDLGCRVISQTVGDRERSTEIIVDRNPHRTIIGCPNVHVTIGRAR